jgi:hypothetical protein
MKNANTVTKKYGTGTKQYRGISGKPCENKIWNGEEYW